MVAKKRLLIYIIVEVALLLTLVGFQIATVIQGYKVYDKSAPLFYPYIALFQVGLTFISLAFALLEFIISKRKRAYFVWPLYFLIISIADIFFSLTPYVLGGHIGFACAYLLFLCYRKPKRFEYIIYGVLIAAGISILAIVKKLSPMIGVDIALGVILVSNLVATWIKYGKSKDKNIRLFAIALTIIVISDLTIALRAVVSNPLALNYAISLITWPTYIAGNILLVIAFLRKQESLL